MSEPLSFDPIAQARRQWVDRWGDEPARPMAAVTSIMRVQQILLARLGELLRPFGLTFPRYETLMVLVFSRTGSLAVGKMGERLQVHLGPTERIVYGFHADASVDDVVESFDDDGFEVLEAIVDGHVAIDDED